MNAVRLTVFCFAVLAMFARDVSAQDMPVPVPVQARFFKKVFTYNKSIPRDGVKLVVVVGDGTAADIKDEIVDSFSSIGIKTTALKASQLSASDPPHVIYVAPGGDVRAVKEFCKTNGVLSISGFPNQARNGDVSISMDAVNDAPKVIVNPDRLKLEKQDAADLMRLR
jgi:hypothetical protein